MAAGPVELFIRRPPRSVQSPRASRPSHAPKLLYRRGGLSHTLSHDLSHRFSHMTYDRPTSEIITRISRAPTLKLGLHGQLPSALSPTRRTIHEVEPSALNSIARRIGWLHLRGCQNGH